MKVFSGERNELGEGPIWHSERNSLFWLDILNRNLFEKKFDSKNQIADKTWRLPEFASAIAQDKYAEHILWMITDKSFGRFNLSKGSFHSVLKLDIDQSHRTNDGGVSPDGTFWFGTMEWTPTGVNGSIYSISKTATIKKQKIRIGIPNTFCWDLDGKVIFISDSFQKKIFSFKVDGHALESKTAGVFVDLSNNHSTPDGGAVDIDGFLWNAHWNGKKVVKYDALGTQQQIVPMPVPKPTSCCFGGPENKYLFVTSARDSMTREEMIRYPLSGNVFVEKQSTPGRPTLPFCLDC